MKLSAFICHVYSVICAALKGLRRSHTPPAPPLVCVSVYETQAGAQMSSRSMKIPLKGARLHFLESFSSPAPSRVIEL